jgi:16S rRNA (cytidine1402-2'-O)-methyltransferase
MQSQKRQEFPPGFYVVATPIGTLSDLSPRAALVLATARVVLCEDTRVTRKLLSASGIEAPELVRMDAHLESSDELEGLAERVSGWVTAGGVVVLVSDAGTPGVSDPGGRIVERVRAQGVSVWSVPGPSSLSAFLSVVGSFPIPMHFWGFAPRGQDELRERVGSCKKNPGFHVFFESPHRISETLTVFSELLSGDTEVCLAKEISKQYERVERVTAAGLMALWASFSTEERKGEWVVGFILNNDNKSNSEDLLRDEERAWRRALTLLIDAGVSASVAARQVSQGFGASRNKVYDAALLLKNKK